VTDDIVTRLREEMRHREWPDMHKEPLFGEAADEIERLRALADQLAVALAAQGSASFDEYTNLKIKRLALDAYMEARHG